MLFPNKKVNEIKMLRCKLISDIHVEFGFDYTLIKNRGEDVLVLAGDVGVGTKMTAPVLQYFSEVFPHVVYVFGNHEFYNNDFQLVKGAIKTKLRNHPNVHILDREAVMIEGIKFIGATLWSSFNNRDIFLMQELTRYISDFHVIQNGDKRFMPVDAADQHDLDWGYIQAEVAATEGKCVVVTHFLPSWQCIAPEYRGETRINHYFATELGNTIVDMKNVPLWMFGHTHTPTDNTIGDTRCVCNPYGYHNKEIRIVDATDPRLNAIFEVAA